MKPGQGTWWLLGAGGALKKESCTLHTMAQNHNVTTIGDSLPSPNKQRSRKMGKRFPRDRNTFGIFQKLNHRRKGIQLASKMHLSHGGSMLQRDKRDEQSVAPLLPTTCPAMKGATL